MCSSFRFHWIIRRIIKTRGNKYKLGHYYWRKYTFTKRVIPIRNSLSDYVVSAEMVNTFKWHSDKFWSDQDVLYNYKADLQGIENYTIIV